MNDKVAKMIELFNTRHIFDTDPEVIEPYVKEQALNDAIRSRMKPLDKPVVVRHGINPDNTTMKSYGGIKK